MRATSTILGTLALAGAAVALGACGGGESPTAGDANANADAARIRFEKCLRDNGVDIPRPANGERRRIVRAADARMRAAMQKCEKYREAAFGNVTPEQREEFRDAFTKFAACMRRHGVDLPDPPAEGEAGAGGRRAAPSTRVERDSPTTQAAQKACQDKLPKGARGGGGGVFIGPGPAR